jgi:hypothetical protein
VSAVCGHGIRRVGEGAESIRSESRRVADWGTTFEALILALDKNNVSYLVHYSRVSHQDIMVFEAQSVCGTTVQGLLKS